MNTKMFPNLFLLSVKINKDIFVKNRVFVCLLVYRQDPLPVANAGLHSTGQLGSARLEAGAEGHSVVYGTHEDAVHLSSVWFSLSCPSHWKCHYLKQRRAD